MSTPKLLDRTDSEKWQVGNLVATYHRTRQAFVLEEAAAPKFSAAAHFAEQFGAAAPVRPQFVVEHGDARALAALILRLLPPEIGGATP